jgi:hypothetical protein
LSTDCDALQQDLQAVYSWAEDVNMIFNGDKFEALRFWPGPVLKPSNSYLDPDGNPIEEKKSLRDLGVKISSDLSFSVHIEEVVAGASKLVGWTLRTFRRRSKFLMLTVWKSLIQSKLDYCSQLWSPSDQANISKLEGVARNFTSRVAGMDGMDYWERLSSLGMYSQERRRERYQIIFIWKLSQGLVQGYHLPFYQSDRRGLLVALPPMAHRSPTAVKRAREASLQVKGARLFNLVPQDLRGMIGVAVDTFKEALDGWLEGIPDRPTIQGRQRAALTNFLTYQVVSNH